MPFGIHSTYHLAQFKDAAALALQMGNSRAMIFKHYRELVKPKDAETYWRIKPMAIGQKVVPITDTPKFSVKFILDGFLQPPLPAEFLHDFPRCCDNWCGHMGILQEQLEPLEINTAQMCVAGQKNRASQEGGFSQDHGVVFFLIRQQTIRTNFRSNRRYDSVSHWHEIHRLEFPF